MLLDHGRKTESVVSPLLLIPSPINISTFLIINVHVRARNRIIIPFVMEGIIPNLTEHTRVNVLTTNRPLFCALLPRI